MDCEPPGNLTLKVSRIWLQNFHRTEETEALGRHKQTLVYPGTQEKGAVTPQETEPDLPVCVCGLWQRHGSTVACCGVSSADHDSPGRPVC